MGSSPLANNLTSFLDNLNRPKLHLTEIIIFKNIQMSQERLPTPVFVEIKLPDVQFQVRKYLLQQTQENVLYNKIQKDVPKRILSAQNLITYDELSTYLH